jgi:hypothetical protein
MKKLEIAHTQNSWVSNFLNDISDAFAHPLYYTPIFILGIIAGFLFYIFWINKTSEGREPQHESKLYQKAAKIKSKGINNLVDALREGYKWEKYYRLGFRLIIATVAGCILLLYKYGSLNYSFFSSGDSFQWIYAIPMVILALVINQILMALQHSDNLRLERYLAAEEHKILESKKEVINNMDPLFKQEVMQLLRRELGI